jgi:hypothetical protein
MGTIGAWGLMPMIIEKKLGLPVIAEGVEVMVAKVKEQLLTIKTALFGTIVTAMAFLLEPMVNLYLTIKLPFPS